MRPISVLLVNPYIYDVSAYGFWSAPLGLLYLGAILRRNGMDVHLLDCLEENEGKRKEDGRAPFVKQRIEAPEALKGIRKPFRRYGLGGREAERAMARIGVPDLILVTSIMTYWYKGAEEMVNVARELFPSAKIVAGGIYPSLCYEHARRRMGAADLVVRNFELKEFYRYVEAAFSCVLHFTPDLREFNRFPYPLFDLYDSRHFVPLLTSLGCMYRCTYCATAYLYPFHSRRDVAGVVKEIVYWQNRGVSRFALYDDSFLYQSERFAKPLLAEIGRLPKRISIYNPNALNASLLDEEAAVLLRSAGFAEVRLGLETADPSLQASTGGKLTRQTFERAVKFLAAAGFPFESIRAYVLAGLPFQKWEDVREAIDYGAGLGVRIDLAEYTPIPHTEMFDRFSAFARFPIAEEPLFQNNALFPFAWSGFTEEDMNALKLYVRQKNSPTKAGYGVSGEG